MRVLYVCTANICRSASAARLLSERLAAEPLRAGAVGVEVGSAGTRALVGAPGCSVAPALAASPQAHTARALTPALIRAADLVLAAARDHRAVIVSMDPAARSRTFTLRQAGRIATWLQGEGMVQAARERAAWESTRVAVGGGAEGLGRAGGEAGSGGTGAGSWAQRFPRGDPRAHVLPMPADPQSRLAWMVAELDAARGMAVAMPESVATPARRWRLRAPVPDPLADVSPDDVADPHVRGTALHDRVYEQIVESTDALLGLMREVLADH